MSNSPVNSIHADDQTTQQADLIVKNAIVLTMNAEKEIFKRGTVVVKDKWIVAVGDNALAEKFDAHNILDVDGDIVMPGMVNAHTHVSMSVFRSLGDDIPDRLRKFIFPLEKKMVSPDMVAIGAQFSNIDMLKGGVTIYADMYYFEDVVTEVYLSTE